MMVGLIQRNLCSVEGRDHCYVPDPHLAPLANKAQAALALRYLRLMQLRNFHGIYPHWCSASVPAVLQQDRELSPQETEWGGTSV